MRLSEKEFRILEYLIANQGRILSREQLAVKVWGYDSDAEYNNVEVYMSFVRRKLNFVKAQTEIKAVRGMGGTIRARNGPDGGLTIEIMLLKEENRDAEDPDHRR